MEYENNDKKIESVFSSKIRAGKRRTYFFDVRATKGNDYFLTITESRKRFDDNGYDRSKIFLYKEDFNKFLKALAESMDYVKTELMPDFDFDAFNHEFDPENPPQYPNTYSTASEPVVEAMHHSVLPEVPVSLPEAEAIEPTTAPSIESTDAPEPNGDNLSDEEVDKW
ncbi:MAG: DUF3276 family protein [Sediminibacterium sp.]